MMMPKRRMSDEMMTEMKNEEQLENQHVEDEKIKKKQQVAEAEEK